ncbi:MAG: hypothetical protein JKY62_16720 [Desulfocapsa sp.]|nr:hypothetical protein [Desulfocapsa sp.]
MMIGPLLMGITSSGGGFAGFTTTPSPIFVDGEWWSFTQTSRVTAPSIGILSRKSIDNGVTWVEDNEQFHTAFITGTTDFANGILAGAAGTFVNHKDLATSGNDWIFTNVSSLGGGFIGGGINLLHTDSDQDRFILNKAEGRDLYTSTDLVTYTPVNGIVENDLTLNDRLQKAHWIVYADGQYVAYGVKETGSPTPPLSPDVYGTASSADLLTWTQETVDAPQFFDIRYFGGAFLAIALGGGGTVKTDIVEVWRSTDFINWLPQTLPNVAAGSSYEQVVIQNGIYTLVSNSQVFETTNGTTFTESTSRFTLDPLIKGKQPRLATFTPPDRTLLRSGSIDELGGKLLGWTASLDAVPTLNYNTTNPAGATIGFSRNTTNGSTGITSNGFAVLNINNARGFYLHKLGVRYFEYTILDADIGADVGMDAPAAHFFSGLGITSVQLTTNAVLTTSGNLPVVYTMAVGQVIGFLVNFITAEIKIYVDNVLLATIPNIETSVLWTQEVDCSGGHILMNIGQEDFVHPQAGSVAWADDYV